MSNLELIARQPAVVAAAAAATAEEQPRGRPPSETRAGTEEGVQQPQHRSHLKKNARGRNMGFFAMSGRNRSFYLFSACVSVMCVTQWRVGSGVQLKTDIVAYCRP